MSAIPRFGNFSSHRADRPLTDEEIQANAPSVLAKGKHKRCSWRYTYIPTAEVLSALGREGFVPFAVSQAKPRDLDRRGYAKHLIRLRYKKSRIQGEEVPEVVLLNSHDGTSSYRMLAGLYRLVCANGLIVGDTALEVRVPHRGDVAGRVVEGAYQVLETFETVLAVRDELRAIVLDRERRLAFARAALTLRWPDRPPVTPEQVLSARRPQDTASSLWATLNVAQENLIRGGLQYRDAHGRWRRTRPITGIDGTVTLNRALWSLAEEMASEVQ